MKRKTLIFPRLHKIPKPPKINFGIFKPVTKLPGLKKNKSANIKKSPEKREERPKIEKKNHILNENYSYIEEQNLLKNNKESDLLLRPKNLYYRLVLEKLKPNKLKSNDLSYSSYDSEEKKINKGTINAIKTLSDYNDESTLFSNKNNKKKINEEINNKLDEEEKKEKEDKNFINKNNALFMITKDNKERVEQYLEKLINKNEYLFKKNFINKYIFENVSKEIFIQKLIKEMDKKEEEIPFYLYEDDLYLQNVFEEIAFKIFIDELEKNQYFYNKNEILPEVIDYHNYLRDFANNYNSIGGKISLDDLYNKEIYIENKNEKEEQEKIREKKLIKNIVKNKKLLILSEKFKDYLNKNKKRLSISFNQSNINNSKLNETSANSSTSFNENYTNIIFQVINNRQKFSSKFESFKKKRNKKLSLEKTELISIEKMIGGHLRTTENKGSIFAEDSIYKKFYKRKSKKNFNKPSSILKDVKYKWHNNDYSYLDCPEFYEKPKKRKLIIEEIKGLFHENKMDNNNKNKRTKSLYNKYFKSKFKSNKP